MSQDEDDKDKVVPLIRSGSASKDGESEADLRVKAYITRLVEARSGNETDACDERQPNSNSVFSAYDLDAIEDEELFQKRFGFSLGAVGRERLFSAIYQYDISDEEVRRLRKSKSIHWDGEMMNITPSWLLVATGGYYLFFLGLYFLAVTILLVSTPTGDYAEIGKVVLYLLFLAALIAGAYKIVDEQLRLFKRIGAWRINL